MKHLSRQQVIALRDGDPTDPRVREHLAGCARCQQRFDDARWDLAQRPLKQEEDGDEHPSKERLLAFWDNALSDPRAARVQRHLRSCSRCRALYRRLRDIAPERAYASPRPALLRSVQRKFAAARVRELGDVVVRRIGDVLGLLFLPREHGDRVTEQIGLMQPPRSRRADPPRSHPGSAAARALRLGESPWLEERIAGPADEHASIPAPSRRVVVAADDLRIELVVAGGAGGAEADGEPLLQVRLTRADGAAERIALRLESPRAGRREARTDRTGRAELPLPAGRSRLIVPGERPVAITVRR